jgi:ABC-type sulfate/molybdate transport systems ATPase subunit
LSEISPVTPAEPSWLDVRIDHKFPGCHLQLACRLSAPRAVVFGPSGSGKSSLLRAVAGLLEPDAGHIRLHGTTVWERTGTRRPSPRVPVEARRVGLVLQSPAIFPHLTVGGNVAYPLRSVARDARREIVLELLRVVGGESLADRWPSELSGGQQQRVAIARTLASNPSTLLLDEPFGALDSQASQQLSQNLFQWAQERSVPALMVTHSLEEAFSGGDEVLVINDGHIVAQGPPQDVLAAERDRLLRAINALSFP